MKKPIKRGPGNTTLTVSLSQELKERIAEAAAADHRMVSPWCVLRLTEVLDRLDAEERGRARPEKLRLEPAPGKEEGNGTEGK
jgi:hypothetical protein